MLQKQHNMGITKSNKSTLKRTLNKQECMELADVDDQLLTTMYPHISRGALRVYKRRGKQYKKLGLAKEAKMGVKLKEVIAKDREKLAQKNKYQQLERKYKYQAKELEQLNQEMDAIHLLRTNKLTHAIQQAPALESGEAVAVTIASDWHVEERVRKEDNSYGNEFTLAIADQRINNFFNRDIKLLSIASKESEIKNHVLALLGDFISGDIHEDMVESAQLSPMEALLWVQERLTAGIQLLLDKTTQNLIIPCHVGNHSRTTEKVRSLETGHSTEYLLYKELALHFSNEKRVRFLISTCYHSYLTLFGKTMRFHHGHANHSHGGVGGILVPLRRSHLQNNITHYADYDISGHFHSSQLDAGNIVVNGSLIGYSAYPESHNIPAEPPRQGFFIIHSKYGKTAMHNIVLD